MMDKSKFNIVVLNDRLCLLNESIAASKDLLADVTSNDQISPVEAVLKSWSDFAEELSVTLEKCHSIAQEAMKLVADWSAYGTKEGCQEEDEDGFTAQSILSDVGHLGSSQRSQDAGKQSFDRGRQQRLSAITSQSLLSDSEFFMQPELINCKTRAQSHDVITLNSRTRAASGAASLDTSLYWNELDALLKEDVNLCCPISLGLFIDPVLASDGFVYERTVLEAALKKRMVSPMTHVPMEADHVPADEQRLDAMAFRKEALEKLLRFAESYVKQEAPVAVVALQRVEAYTQALKQDAPREALSRAAAIWAKLHKHNGAKVQFENSVDLDSDPMAASIQSNISRNQSTSTVSKSNIRAATNLQKRLEVLLASSGNATALAETLYSRFDGNLSKIGQVEMFLSERFGFPDNSFPFLRMHLKRVAVASGGDDSFVNEHDWTKAFAMWLQTIQARMGQASLSRKHFVRKAEDGHKDDLKAVYFQGPVLGEGAFGTVSVMLHKSLGVERVVKTIDKAKLTADVAAEVALLKELDHLHVIRIYETLNTDEALYIVMDYAEGGDLSAYISKARREKRRFPEPWVCIVSDQMLAGLEYVHWKDVIHCDLKPANTMFLRKVDPFSKDGPQPHLVLVDFGLSEICDRAAGGQKGASKVKGTPLYLAPEGFQGQMSAKCDVWSAGVIVYEMLKGERLFQEKNAFALWAKINKSNPNLDEFCEHAQEVLKKLLAKDPEERPSAAQIRRMDWFKSSLVDSALSESGFAFLKQLGYKDYFHRTAMMCIASELSLKDRKDILETFQCLDRDRDGRLSQEQVAKALEQVGRQEDLHDIFKILDMDNNGYISYTEFVAGVLRIDGYLSERLVDQAFNALDRRKTGFIGKQDLQALLSDDDGGPMVECFPDGHTIDEVLDIIGSHGKISPVQFRNHLRNVAKEDETASEFPMMVMPMSYFLEMSSVQPYDQLMDAGLLVEAPEGAATHYISWQWLTSSHPDPDCKQLMRLQRFFRTMMKPGGASEAFTEEGWHSFSKGAAKQNSAQAQAALAQLHRRRRSMERGPDNGGRQSFDEDYAEDIKDGYVWVDYSSIPSLSANMTADECVLVQRQRTLAITSTPRYISRATYFYMCAVKRTTDKQSHLKTKDFNSWRQGGWCRAEELANFLSPKESMSPIVITEAPKASVLDFFDFWVFRGNRPLQSIFNGSFSCCKKGHTKSVAGGRKWFTPCDKHLLEDMVESMYRDKMRALRAAGHEYLFRCYRVMEPSIFSGANADHFQKVYPLGESIEEFMERILYPSDPKSLDANGATALKWAAYMGHEHMIKKLIDAGCPATLADKGGLTALHAAATSCDALAATTVMIQAGDLDESALNAKTNGFGITPLDRAAKSGLPEVARLLLESKARTDVCRTDGLTPLGTAASMGHLDVCQVLLDFRADINFQSTLTGAGALHCCAQEFQPFGQVRSERMKVVEMLIKNAVDVNLRDVDGRTAMDLADAENNQEFELVLQNCLAASKPAAIAESPKELESQPTVDRDNTSWGADMIPLQVNSDMKNKIKELFAEVAQNSDGTVKMDLFATVLRTLLGPRDFNKPLQNLIAAMSEAKQATLKFDEFVDWFFGDGRPDDDVDKFVKSIMRRSPDRS